MPLLIKIDPVNPDEKAVAEAAAVLGKGGVIAFPTETFYGLGADGENEKAVEKVYAIKGRSFAKPLPLIIGSRQDLGRLVREIPAAARALMDALWPGGLTLVFKASPLVLQRLTAGTGKIGIRLSSSRIASRLAAAVSRPVTATSANPSGGQECTSADEVLTSLGDRVDAVIDGGHTPGGLGSTMVDVTVDPPTILRAGVIPASLIQDILRKNG